MRVADREVGLGHPALLVAEVSGNHLGSLNRALALIHAAEEAGADAVKFQAFSMDEILALRGTGQAPPPWESMTLPELYAKVITPRDWFPRLFDEVRSCGLIPFASVFGLESLAMLESLDCPAYKIAKPDRKAAFLNHVAVTGKPMLVSTTNHQDVLRGYAVWCPGGYPARHLNVQGLCWDCYIGVSCHVPDPLAGALCVASGAPYLEFHLTLDDGVPTLDDCVNLTALRFREMVHLVRRAEAML